MLAVPIDLKPEGVGEFRNEMDAVLLVERISSLAPPIPDHVETVFLLSRNEKAKMRVRLAHIARAGNGDMTIHTPEKYLWTQMLSGKPERVVNGLARLCHLLDDDEGVRKVLAE